MSDVTDGGEEGSIQLSIHPSSLSLSPCICLFLSFTDLALSTCGPPSVFPPLSLFLFITFPSEIPSTFLLRSHHHPPPPPRLDCLPMTLCCCNLSLSLSLFSLFPCLPLILLPSPSLFNVPLPPPPRDFVIRCLRSQQVVFSFIANVLFFSS